MTCGGMGPNLTLLQRNEQMIEDLVESCTLESPGIERANRRVCAPCTKRRGCVCGSHQVRVSGDILSSCSSLCDATVSGAGAGCLHKPAVRAGLNRMLALVAKMGCWCCCVSIGAGAGKRGMLVAGAGAGCWRESARTWQKSRSL